MSPKVTQLACNYVGKGTRAIVEWEDQGGRRRCRRYIGDGGERQFNVTGAIDEPSICEVITSTMEGGEKAFKDRRDKYG